MTTPKPKKPTKRSLERALADRLSKLVPKLGLAPAKPPRQTVFFARWPATQGLTHAILIRGWARDEVRLCVWIEHDVLSPRIAEALGTPEPVPLVNAALQEFWRDKDGGLRVLPSKRPVDTLSISNVGRAAGAIVREIERYGLPLFDRLSSLAKLDEFWHGDPTSLLWSYTFTPIGLGGVKESHALPVDAFVGAAIARAMGRSVASTVSLYEKRFAKQVDARWRARQLVRLKAVAAACEPL